MTSITTWVIKIHYAKLRNFCSFNTSIFHVN